MMKKALMSLTSLRWARAVVVVCSLFVASFSASGQGVEPNVDLAKLWWPDQCNVWTPLGWPDHYHKFSVVYNGTLVFAPAYASHQRRHAQAWRGKDYQLTFRASKDGAAWKLPSAYGQLRDLDDGRGVQSWDPDHKTPVLRTEFRNKDGIVLQTETFADIPGFGPVQTALEPEFARIRVKVKHVDDYNHPDRYVMSVLLSRAFLDHTFNGRMAPEITVVPTRATSDSLTMKPLALGGRSVGERIVCGDTLVRMDVLPGEGVKAELKKATPKLYHLCLTFPPKEGAYADLIFPLLCVDEQTAQAEATISFDEALNRADAYWQSLKPETLAEIHVPEAHINEAIQASLKYIPVLAEKDHVTGQHSFLSGVWTYDALWSTPVAMQSAMFMDQMGAFDAVKKYSEIFLLHQGTAKAPGEEYDLHPGYFCTPRHLQSFDWLTDHGAIMYLAANHALITADPAFIARWTEPLVKACDFIKDYSLKPHSGVAGLLPAAKSTDEAIPLPSCWNLAWNYKGMAETVRLLEKIGHPRAAEFADFLQGFKKRFNEVYREVVKAGPTWTDCQGGVRFRPPSEVYIVDPAKDAERKKPYTSMTDAFYLDGGPMVLVWAGLMDADDPIMRDIVDFFREGPNWDLRQATHWSLERPVLEHEMSSCEPCYSFNVFHNWQLADRAHYLEGMYSILVGSVSQNTYISCEHRHGVQGNLFSFPLGFYLARLAVIDDQIDRGNLHLLRMCPLAWIRSNEETSFRAMPTEFGPVDLTFSRTPDGRTLEVAFSAQWRERPGQIVLHVPPMPGLKYIRFGGRKYPAAKGQIIVKP